MEKKNLVFSYRCLVGEIESEVIENFFVWLRKIMRGYKVKFV